MQQMHCQFILGMIDTSPAKWPQGFSSISFENSGQVTTDTGGGKCYLTHSSKTCQNSSIIFRSSDCADQESCSTSLSYLSNHSVTSCCVYWYADMLHHLQGAMFESMGVHDPSKWFCGLWKRFAYLVQVQ